MAVWFEAALGIAVNLASVKIGRHLDRKEIKRLLAVPRTELEDDLARSWRGSGVDESSGRSLLDQAGEWLRREKLSLDAFESAKFCPEKICDLVRTRNSYKSRIRLMGSGERSAFDSSCLKILDFICSALPQIEDVHKRVAVQTLQTVAQSANDIRAARTASSQEHALISSSIEDQTHTLVQLQMTVRGLSETLERQISGQCSDNTAGQISTELLRAVCALIPALNQNPVHATSMPPPDEPPQVPMIAASRSGLLNDLELRSRNLKWLALVGVKGMGKTYLADRLEQKIHSGPRCWISLAGHQPSSAVDHLRHQLVRWAVEMAGQTDTWQMYSSGVLPFSRVIDELHGLITGGAVVVVDNLPGAVGCEDLIGDLIQLSRSLGESGSLLITTGHDDLPSTVERELGNAAEAADVPGLNEEDIREMLHSAGASGYWLGNWAVIQVATKGHPALVSACIAWLRNREWPSDQQTLQDVLLGVSSDQVRVQADRLAYSLIADHDTRALLDRLSLADLPFGPETLHAVADVPPTIDSPVARLDQMRGVWISALSDGRYSVIPLLRDVGKRHLKSSEQIDTHRAIADGMLRKTVLDMSEASSLAFHLLGARMWGDLAVLVFQLLFNVHTPDQARMASWLTYLLPPDYQALADLDQGLWIMMRALQTKVRTGAGYDATDLLRSFEQMLAECEPEHYLVASLALASLGLMDDLMPPVDSARYALRSARLFAAALPSHSEAASFVPEGYPEQGVWSIVPRLASITDIGGFIDVLDDMTAEEAARAQNGEIAFAGAQILADRSWVLELEKPEETRKWSDVCAVLERLTDLAAKPGWHWLSAYVARAQAIVTADHLGDSKKGLTLLAQARPVNDDQTFLLKYTQACILIDSGRVDQAYESYHDALAHQGDQLQQFRFDAFRLKAEAAGRLGLWSEAISAARDAYRFEAELSDELSRLEMLGEIAWAQWCVDDRIMAFAAMYALVKGLVGRADMDNPRFREAARKTNHALGWLCNASSANQEPIELVDGSSFAPPFPGLFSRGRPQLADAPIPLSLGASYSLLATMADNLGLVGRWVAASTAARRTAVGEGDDLLAAMASVGEICGLALRGLVPEAVEVAIPSITAISAFASLEQPRSPVTSGLKMEEAEALADPGKRADLERPVLFYEILCPAFLSLLRRQAAATDALKTLDAWDEALTTAKLFSGEHYHSLVRMMRFAFAPDSEAELRNRLGQDLDDQSRIVAYIALTTGEDHPLWEVARAHAVVLHWLASSSSQKHALRAFASYVVARWRHIAEYKGVLLSQPRLLRDLVADLSGSDVVRSSARILEIAELCTGSKYPNELWLLLSSLADVTGHTRPSSSH